MLHVFVGQDCRAISVRTSVKGVKVLAVTFRIAERLYSSDDWTIRASWGFSASFRLLW